MSANNRDWVVENGVLVSVPSHIRNYLDRSDVSELFWGSGSDISLGYLAYCSACEINWICCEPWWYPYDFDIGEISGVVANFESGQKREHDGVVLNERSLPCIPAVLVEGIRCLQPSCRCISPYQDDIPKIVKRLRLWLLTSW